MASRGHGPFEFLDAVSGRNPHHKKNIKAIEKATGRSKKTKKTKKSKKK